MSGSLTADVELDEQKRFRSTFVLSYLEYGFETRTRTIECLKYGQVRLQFTRRQMEVPSRWEIDITRPRPSIYLSPVA